MKKYYFAKFYLTALLIIAIFIAVAGVCRGLYLGNEAVKAYSLSQSLPKKTVSIDTQTVFDVFRETTEILNRNHLVSTTQSVRFTPEVQKDKPAQLALKEITDFESALQQMSTDVSNLKHQSILRIQENLEKLLTGSLSALPTPSTPLSAPTPTILKAVEHPFLLFADSEVFEKDILILKQCSDFLRLRVRSYTPSEKAQTLAINTDTNLQVLIDFLMNQTQAIKASKAIIMVSSSSRITAETPSEREERIREFILYLQRIEAAVEYVMIKEWTIDQEIASAQKSAKEARINILTEISIAKQRANTLVISMAELITASLTIALLLLVIREFMSAVIDTASNTGGMLNKLTGENKDKSGTP